MTSELVRPIFTITIYKLRTFHESSNWNLKMFVLRRGKPLVLRWRKTDQNKGIFVPRVTNHVTRMNGIRTSREYQQQTQHSYATSFPGLRSRREPVACGRCCTHLCRYLPLLQLLRDSNPGHTGWRGGLSSLRYSCANLSTLSGLSKSSSTGDQRKRAAWSHLLPHPYFLLFPSREASSCVRRFHARFRPVYFYSLGKIKVFSWSRNPLKW